MTREEFVAGYMGRSGITDYRIDGETVWMGDWPQYALECDCEEEGCDGWAMIPLTARGWHEFQNGRMTYDEGVVADHAAREAEKPGWHAANGFA